MMRRSLSWFLVAAAALWAVPVESRAAPSLEFSQTKLDFGRLPVRVSETRVVTLRNRSSQTVTIEKINSTCGCAKGSIAGRVVPPGGTTELLVTAKPIKAKKRTGVLFIYSDDPEQPRTVVKLKVEGYEPLKSQPEFVQFGNVTCGEGKKETFKLTVPEQDNLKITGFRYNEQLFAVSAAELSSAGNGTTATIRVRTHP